jgi:ribosome biogenesis protein MAK21
MALKKSRREALMAVDSIKDLLLGSLLPDRKLKYFSDQPFSATKCTSMHLVLWYFEDLLKKFYYRFIQLLEVRFSTV